MPVFRPGGDVWARRLRSTARATSSRRRSTRPRTSWAIPTPSARDQFDDVSEDVRKNLKKTARRLEKDYGPVWEDVRRYVRENPGTALAISLGAGFLFGFLVRGGDD